MVPINIQIFPNYLLSLSWSLQPDGQGFTVLAINVFKNLIGLICKISASTPSLIILHNSYSFSARNLCRKLDSTPWEGGFVKRINSSKLWHRHSISLTAWDEVELMPLTCSTSNDEKGSNRTTPLSHLQLSLTKQLKKIPIIQYLFTNQRKWKSKQLTLSNIEAT